MHRVLADDEHEAAVERERTFGRERTFPDFRAVFR
jgi:hypothetical protein